MKIDIKDVNEKVDVESNKMIAKKARKLIIDMAASKVGCHIGGSLSVVDILVSVYSKYKNDKYTKVILSKGHSAAALYAVLKVNNIIEDDIKNLYGDYKSFFTGHPNHNIPGISFSTGSLGHGVAYAAGHALAQKLKKTDGLGIAICGDGELQEGLCWETFQIVQAKKIQNYVIIVDYNQMQNDGYLDSISSIKNLKERFNAFSFEAKEVDGHDFNQILETLNCIREKPLAIIAKTIKSKGVKYIENNPNTHYAKIPQNIADKWKRSLV